MESLGPIRGSFFIKLAVLCLVTAELVVSMKFDALGFIGLRTLRLQFGPRVQKALGLRRYGGSSVNYDD